MIRTAVGGMRMTGKTRSIWVEIMMLLKKQKDIDERLDIFKRILDLEQITAQERD